MLGGTKMSQSQGLRCPMGQQLEYYRAGDCLPSIGSLHQGAKGPDRSTLLSDPPRQSPQDLLSGARADAFASACILFLFLFAQWYKTVSSLWNTEWVHHSLTLSNGPSTYLAKETSHIG